MNKVENKPIEIFCNRDDFNNAFFRVLQTHQLSNEKPVVIELYNLYSDPGETKNVADIDPGVLEEILPLFDEAHDYLSGLTY